MCPSDERHGRNGGGERSFLERHPTPRLAAIWEETMGWVLTIVVIVLAVIGLLALLGRRA